MKGSEGQISATCRMGSSILHVLIVYHNMRLSSTQDVLGASCCLEIVAGVAVEGDDLLSPVELRNHVASQIDVVLGPGNPVVSLRELFQVCLEAGVEVVVFVDLGIGE